MSQSEPDNNSERPEETLRIQNFGGITDATISLSRMNVFIGPQASGKSVCAKLFFYFREIVRQLAIDIFSSGDVEKIDKRLRDLFLLYFPSENWGQGGFSIHYDFGLLRFHIEGNSEKEPTVIMSNSLFWSEVKQVGFDTLYDLLTADTGDGFMPDPIATTRNKIEEKIKKEVGSSLNNSADFIAAGRSFFLAFDRMNYIIQSQGIEIDPFIAEFGRLYQVADNSHRIATLNSQTQSGKLQGHIERILCGKYILGKGGRFIFSEDGRKVRLENCSSGQQEASPLVIILEHIHRQKDNGQNTTLFVEEPEAHLYPDAQREMVHLLCTALDLTSPESTSQCVITTHSPYILTALNNLMYGAKIIKEFPEQEAEIRRVLGDTDLIAPKDVRAYLFENGGVTSILSDKTQLVVASAIDGVSDKLAQEFESIVEIALEAADSQ